MLYHHKLLSYLNIIQIPFFFFYLACLLLKQTRKSLLILSNKQSSTEDFLRSFLDSPALKRKDTKSKRSLSISSMRKGTSSRPQSKSNNKTEENVRKCIRFWLLVDFRYLGPHCVLTKSTSVILLF